MKTWSLFFLLCLSNGLFAQTQVQFILKDLPSSERDKVGIRGSQAPLSWDQSIPLTEQEGAYRIDLSFPDSVAEVEFKFVRYTDEADQEVVWEGIENRFLSLLEDDAFSQTYRWDVEATIDISTLSALQPEALLQDYALIERMVLDVHPGTYRHQDSATIMAQLASLKERFSQPLSHGAAYLAISQLLASLQCDHTFASFYNQGSLLKSVIHRQPDKVPFTFRWLDERMIVVYDATADNLLPPGTEILQINGVKTADILTHLLPYVSADGPGDHSRRAHLEVRSFDFRYDAFDVFYPLVFPVEGNELSLEVQAYGEDSSRILTVNTLSREERTQRLGERYERFPQTRDDLWQFEITEDRIGVLTMGDFGLMGWKRLTLDYQQFLADAFAQLRKEKIAHLVLDIRSNTGGMDEMVTELMTYLPVDRLVEKDREGRTRYTSFPEELKPFLQSWGDPWYYELSPEAEREGYYIFAEGAQYDQRNPQKKHVFNGEIFLLTSGVNASLAYYLPQKARKYQFATLIGQETGGNLQGINGGQIVFLRLPNSRIEIDFPVMGDFTISSQPSEGVKPDVEVQTRQQDIATGRDAELEKVRELIRE